MRSQLATSVILVVTLITSGCLSQPTPPTLPDWDPRLTSGEWLFGDPVPMPPAHDVLAASESMRAFISEDIASHRLAVVRFHRLLDKLKNTGFFTSKYDPGVTGTAADTFDAQVGNCISYTNLFVALARLANLQVSYQIVPPEHPRWDVSNGLLIKNNHINVVVQGPRFDLTRSDGRTVDFNRVQPDPGAKAVLVSDAYAASLYYANLSVEALTAGDVRTAFAWLRRALDTEPANADLWINLGALYARLDKHEHALKVLGVARALDPTEKIILSGLERSHRQLGHTEIADDLARQVRHYRNRNPYYHFAVAEQALADGELDLSEVSLARALRLRKREPRFHVLQSRLLNLKGDARGAEHSLALAQRYADRARF